MSLDKEKKNSAFALEKKICAELKLMLDSLFIAVLIVSFLWYILELFLYIFFGVDLLSVFNVNCDEPLLFWLGKVASVGNSNSFSLDPAMAVITAFGAGGVTLSAVNEVKTKNSHGVPMADAIDYFFPLHKLIYLAHFFFTMIGLYSCAADKIYAAAWAMICVGMCFVYTAHLAYISSFRDSAEAKLVRPYIRTKYEQLLGEKKGYCSDAESMLYDTALYIGEEYCRRSSCQLEELIRVMGEDFDTLIDFLPELGTSDASTIKEEELFFAMFSKDKQYTINNGNTYKKQAKDMVMLCNSDIVADKYGINEKENYYSFYRCIIICELVWRNIFRALQKGKHNKAELASAVLICAYEKRQTVFLLLVCGLIAHELKSISPFDGNSLFLHINLLQDIISCSDRIAKKDRDGFSYRRSIGLLGMCTYFWTTTLYLSCNRDEYTYSIGLFREIVGGSIVGANESRKLASYYMAYSYFTFLVSGKIEPLPLKRIAWLMDCMIEAADEKLLEIC